MIKGSGIKFEKKGSISKNSSVSCGRRTIGTVFVIERSGKTQTKFTQLLSALNRFVTSNAEMGYGML